MSGRDHIAHQGPCPLSATSPQGSRQRRVDREFAPLASKMLAVFLFENIFKAELLAQASFLSEPDESARYATDRVVNIR